MMVLNPAPEGGLGASLRPGLTGLVQSDKQGGMRTYSSSNELTFSSIWRQYLVWRKNNDLNPVFHQNCKRLFSFTGICDRLWDFGPYGGTWAKLGFLHNLTCSHVLSIPVNF